MTPRSGLLLAAALSIAAPAVHAADPTAGPDEPLACHSRPALPEGRPRIGLVLGGGGARGISHIAVLRALEQMQVPVDCIAGTSMGALVGALYASGMSVDDIEKLVLELDWETLFDDQLERPERSYRRKRDDELVVAQPGIGVSSTGVRTAAGLLGGERILLTFARLVGPVSTVEDFDDLPIPYRAVAADINDGSTVVLDHGDLAMAMRASMSIPGVFPPVEHAGRVLVDGGVARNLPVEVVRDMGADIVIAVDVGTPLATVTSGSSVLSIAGQLGGLLTVSNTRQSIASLAPQDVLVSPPLGDTVKTGDFGKGREALAIGEQGVAAVRPRLQALGIGEAAYAQNLSVRTGRASAPPVVQFVRLDNRTRYRDDVLLQRVQVPLGEPLDTDRLEDQLYQVFGYTTLSQATYEVVQEAGQTGVVLHVVEKSQGPNYLEAGLSASGDLQGEFDLNIRLGVLRSPINDRGGEHRTLLQLGSEKDLLSEYYQPFGADGRYVFGVRGQYFDRKFNSYDDDGNRLSETRASHLGLQLTAGREFGNYGAVTLGYRRFTGETEVAVGPPAPDADFEVGEAYLDVTVDRVDSFYFPREGYLVRNRYLVSRGSLGADTDFDQWDFDGLYARRFGLHSLQVGGRYHATVSGVAPLQSTYRIGGFTRLVGYRANELNGQNYALLFGGYNYRIADLFRQDALLGGVLEYGNVWDQRSEIDFDTAVLNGAVYVGIDSWIGPVLLGIGAREGGEYNAFLEIGHRF